MLRRMYIYLSVMFLLYILGQLQLIPLLQFVMDKSDLCQSSIAQQQIVIIKSPEEKREKVQKKVIKYVNAHEIKTFERLSQAKNHSFKQSYPTSFNYDYQHSQPHLHFVSEKESNYFLKGQQKQNAYDVIQKTTGQILVKMPLNNILRQNTLKLQLNKFKKDKVFVIQSNEILDEVKNLRFKYTITLLQGSFLIKIIINIDSTQKLWKQMEIPLIENQLKVEIHEFNNEQTDIRINNYVFHLILKTPYSSSCFYSCLHENAVTIQKLQLISMADTSYSEPNEINCSKECQLI